MGLSHQRLAEHRPQVLVGLCDRLDVEVPDEVIDDVRRDLRLTPAATKKTLHHSYKP
jgi:hypothetical protein